MNEAHALVSKVCAACGARYPTDALFCPTDGTPLQSAAAVEPDAADPYVGQEISGHIEIRQLVGIGAMGRVYRAFQRGIDRDVAVKVLHRELSANAQLVSRFTREAKVASRLQHPNVVQVLLAGQLPDRALYMVMEFLDGLSLQSALAAAGGALPLSRALHVGLQLCDAVGEAHAQGIVHRDMKPENVMLVRRGSDDDFVKVLDFGIARINWGEQSVATAAGLIFGTARYISPEGAQGNAVGPASDVYSIATLLYQMLSGRTPFEGDQAVGLLVQQIHDTPPHLATLPRARYVPEPLAEVVMANLVKEPGRREPDARAFGQAIVDAAKRAGLSPEEISRPILRRPSSAMQLPPLERTKQLDLTPDLAARLSPTPGVTNDHATSGAALARAPSGATVKWEPPGEFKARLAQGVADAEHSSGVVAAHAPTSSPSLPETPRARATSVDETLDDATAHRALPAGTAAAPSAPARTAVPRTLAGEESRPRTEYAPPAPHASEPALLRAPDARAGTPRPSEPSLTPVRSRDALYHEAHDASDEGRGRSRSVIVVLLCFVLGGLLAAGIAWRMGKLGGEPEPDRFAARATDAMYKNHFAEPAGDNVREITDEALRRWPGDRRFLEIRGRAANELITQALAHRTSSDASEALRLARLAVELDPSDMSAKRLVEQLEGELAAAAASAPPLPRQPPPPPPPASVKATGGAPTPPPPLARVALETAPAQPRPSQPAELSARLHGKATVEGAAFVVSGPGLGAAVKVAAQATSVGVYKAPFSFPQPGRYEVVFSGTDGGRALRAARTVVAGEGVPVAAPTPAPKPTAPPPAPTASVKWL